MHMGTGAEKIVVGIGECAVSTEAAADLLTYALGSCIAVVLHDPVARVGGLLHFLLPESSLDPAKAKLNPYLYGDTGIPAMLEHVLQAGAKKQRLTVRVAGGAQVLDDKGVFNIGKRNHVAMRKALWKSGLLLHGEATGGSTSRSVRLEIASGKVQIKEGLQQFELQVAAGKGVA
jgi:chemotaxis protein CheD